MHILCLTCLDKPGIVAAVSGALENYNCNIEESSQFNDPRSKKFYMRVVFTGAENDIEKFTNSFTDLAQKFEMEWKIADLAKPLKTIVMVSQYDHCLHHLLYQTKNKTLPIEITAVISNHEKSRTLTSSYNIPFHYLPTSDNKLAQEADIRQLIKNTQSELIVMARYMQILSKDFIDDYSGRVINIHHSFLPGFKGARPYYQAYERGVKSIGATAHFATTDLDEGPIIAQSVVSVNHTHTPQKMQALGRDTESLILSEAVKYFAEHRIFIHDNRTIIL